MIEEYCRCPGCGDCGGREKADKLANRNKELRATLRDIANFAHEGGAANLSETAVLILIRKLTLKYWDGGRRDAP